MCRGWVEVGGFITAGRCVCGGPLYYSLHPRALSVLHDENTVKGCCDGPCMSGAASCSSPSCLLSAGGDQARDAGVFRESLLLTRPREVPPLSYNRGRSEC